MKLFFIAISFLTRIPLLFDTEITTSEFSASQKYFTLVGLLIGVLTAVFFFLASLFFSTSLAIIFSMIFSVLLTGAFHEDGLADTLDGLGGAFTPENKLKIMKDSRIGTYGVVALIFVFLLKYHLLVEQASIPLAIILGHTLSRLFAVSIQCSLNYVQNRSDSKVGSVTQGLDDFFLIPSIILSLIAMWLVLGFWYSMQIVIVLLALRWFLVRVYRAQIGGYTGDTLGAAQQFSEIFIYLFLII